MKRPNLSVTLVVVSLAITLPYIIAALTAGPEHVFTGVLLNPQDGASYLAKMYEGWRGSWRFTLPYTSEQGTGTYIFLYYLFLGHLARLIGLPLAIMYHLARLVGSGLLLLALIGFFDRLFRDRPDLYRLVFWLTVIGSGMGWLVVFLGATPSDFWVAEAFPFLSMFINPHFPTGLALVVWSFRLLIDPSAHLRNLKLLLAGLLISLILQFGLVVALLVAAAWVTWTWIETRRRLEWQPLVCLGLLGGPYLLYQYWVVTQDPVLAGWTAQNLTASPPIWDFLLSFSPALLLALVGIPALYRQKEHPARRLLIAWFVLGLILIYLPFSLQRRFMLGFYIPTAALAVFGLDDLRQRFAGRTRWLAPVMFGLALPTNVFLILITLFGAFSHAPELFLTRDEAAALNWVNQQTPAQALVLASPEIGSWIPAMTGRRVIYGHPFETLNADAERQRVEDYFSGKEKPALGGDWLTERGVNYLLVGPRERDLGNGQDFSALNTVFTSDTVNVYQVGAQP